VPASTQIRLSLPTLTSPATNAAGCRAFWRRPAFASPHAFSARGARLAQREGRDWRYPFCPRRSAVNWSANGWTAAAEPILSFSPRPTASSIFWRSACPIPRMHSACADSSRPCCGPKRPPPALLRRTARALTIPPASPRRAGALIHRARSIARRARGRGRAAAAFDDAMSCSHRAGPHRPGSPLGRHGTGAVARARRAHHGRCSAAAGPLA
jgi:hypothetical protein